MNPNGRMVLHGYKRPGTGNVVGDCFGVGYPPYEQSSSGCSAYRDQLALWRSGYEESIRKYEERPEQIDGYSRINRTYTTYRRDSSDPIEQDKYEKALQVAINAAKSQIAQIDFSDRRMTKLIEQWAPGELIEIDEEGRTPEMRREQATRREERAAAKLERDAKRAAKQAKADARSAAAYAQFKEFERQIAVLAQMPKSPDRALQAKRLNAQMVRVYPYGIVWYGYKDHGPEAKALSAMLVELGLGEYDEKGTYRHFRHVVARGKPEIPPAS